MSYEVKSTDKNDNVTLEVRHVGERTTVTTDLTVHLCPHAIDPKDRVTPISIDVTWIRGGPTLVEAAEEIARILSRLAAGLREGPGPKLHTMGVPLPPTTEDDGDPKENDP